MRLSPRVRVEANEIIGFFCERTDASPLALFRVLYGVLAIWTSLLLFPNFERYYTESGRMPWDRVKHFPEHIYSILQFGPQSHELLQAIVWAQLFASIFVLVGLWARAGALTIFLIQVALQHRNPFILNSGDHLFLITAFLLMLGPSDRVWSVSSFLKRRFNLFSKGAMAAGSVPAWSTRLIGLQICYVYLYAFAAKINSKPWISGTAMYDVLASPSLARWPAELQHPIPLALATWGTLVFELFFPLFVWQKPFRRYAIPIGILFHLGIEVSMVLPMFSALMMISYATFLDDEEAHALVNYPLRIIGLRPPIARRAVDPPSVEVSPDASAD